MEPSKLQSFLSVLIFHIVQIIRKLLFLQEELFIDRSSFLGATSGSRILPFLLLLLLFSVLLATPKREETVFLELSH